MRDKIIIFGTHIGSRDLYIKIQQEGQVDVVAYTVNKEFIKDVKLDELPVVPFEDIENKYSPSEFQILNTIGYSQMNLIREKVFYEINAKGYKNYTYISPRAIIYTNKIEEGCIIDPTAFLGPNVELGKGNIISPGVILSHRIKLGDFNFLSTGVMSAGVVEITNNCYIGIGATLNNGIILAPKTFIGAASFITTSTEENRAYIGSPAKMVKAKSSIVAGLIGSQM